MALNVQWDLGHEAARDIAASLNILLADGFALLLKTKGCRWNVSSPQFPGHQPLFREFEEQINVAIDGIAERIRRIGAAALISIGDISRVRRLIDIDFASLSTIEMLAVLLEDNLQFVAYLREAHYLCEGYGDVATARRLEKWIDDAEGRVRNLFPTSLPTQGVNTTAP